MKTTHATATRLITAVSAATIILGACVSHADVPEMANIIRQEALRSQHDPGGRPLPLVAHWHRASMPLSLQLQMIKDGIPILPWMNYYRKMKVTHAEKQAAEIQTLRDWKLPFSLITGGQWELDFYYNDPIYSALPIEETGCGLALDGSRIKQLSPMSPIEPWHGLGVKWTDNPMLRAVQKLYPDPPLVFLISNNEAKEIPPNRLEIDKRYYDLYGTTQTDEFKRRFAGDRYIERYTAMFKGMRDGMVEDSWKKNSKIVGYGAFGPDKWGAGGAFGSGKYTTSDRVTHNWHMWEGSLSESYDNDWEPNKTAFNLWSMQTELMNLHFMKDEAWEVNPNFWFELIAWDGYTWRDMHNKKAQNYSAAGVEYTSELYKGWTQYTMWLLTPRVMREYRSSADNKENWWERFQVVIDMVVDVHQDPLLQRFWRKGALVLNPSRPHPFNAKIPAKWENEERWFHLSTNLDPDLSSLPKNAQMFKSDYQFKVFTLARVIGESPNREWLLYAHAPMGEQQNVVVTIPGYRDVTLQKVAIAGTFYHVNELGNNIKVIDPAQLPAPTGLRIH